MTMSCQNDKRPWLLLTPSLDGFLNVITQFLDTVAKLRGRLIYLLACAFCGPLFLASCQADRKSGTKNRDQC